MKSRVSGPRSRVSVDRPAHSRATDDGTVQILSEDLE